MHYQSRKHCINPVVSKYSCTEKMQNYCSILTKCPHYFIFRAASCILIYHSSRGEQLCCKLRGQVLSSVALIRKRQCVQGATLDMVMEQQLSHQCHPTFLQVLSCSWWEHRSYSHELSDISSWRVKVRISCEKAQCCLGQRKRDHVCL